MSKLPTLLIKGNLRADNPKQQKELDEWVPLDYIIEWFKLRMYKTGPANKVLILKSETASGKSTAFPPELYKQLVRGRESAGIICTQPRVATAVENVVEMLKHNSKTLRLGETIGWSTKNNKFRLKSVGLLSATIGTLAQQLKTFSDEEIIKKYRFILIDETHERDLQTDMTIYMLKNLLNRNADNPNCPFVVLMSATFSPEPFLKYFDVTGANFIWCGGQTAHIEEMWDWNDGRTVNDYPRAASAVVEKIIDSSNDDISRADILIFMPGKAEFKETVKWLDKYNQKLAKSDHSRVFSLLQIDGPAFQTQNRDFMLTVRVPTQEHRVSIDGKVYTPSRRVIISTNVAETGLTLENLKYVIDSGFNREIEYNPVLGIRGLITKPAPISRIRQRRGRAGRKFDGVFYPLYPKFIYDRLPAQQFPQILIEDISVIMLDIIAEQIKSKSNESNPAFNIEDIDMIDVPTPDAISAAVEKMYTLGFISPQDIRITELGLLAKSMSLPPEVSRMILAAYYWGASILDVITMAAYVSMDLKSFVKAARADDENVRIDIKWGPIYKLGLPGWVGSATMLYKIRLMICDEFIHGIILFNAIKNVIKTPRDSLSNLQKWCDDTNLSMRTCLDFIRARDDIIEQLLTLQFDIFSNESNSLSRATDDSFMTVITRLKYCIYDGFRNNIIMRDESVFRTLNGQTVAMPGIFRDDEKQRMERDGYQISVLPTFVIYKELSLKYNRKTMVYDVLANCISVMDGFVSCDLDFTT